MDTHTDYFHHLPDEVIQLIFSRVTDCKTLVQCMSVSKAFRQHAVRVSSLSIVCPGSFATYDERLLKIYTMVKAFRNLQSLVVRVGQPKEEPPSWARCMRYAEIGGSVEKFMFMAAKCGDFSELDASLLGLDDMGDKLQGKAWKGFNVPAPLDVVVHTDMDRQCLIETSNSSSSMGKTDTRNIEARSDVESNEEGGQIGLLDTIDLSNFDTSSNQKLQEKWSQCSRLTPFDATFLLEPGQRKPLSQLSLRQVIAPSNDVLKRMLPVIHFAIVQGLNELRDSLPGFVAMFAELRSFLLVDMAESITVYMREHHIQELKSLYLQDCDGTVSQVKEALKAEPFFSEPGLGRDEDQAKCSSGKMEERDAAVAGKADQTHFEMLDSRHVKCTEEVVDSGENGCVSVKDEQVDEMVVITKMPKAEVEKSNSLTVSINEERQIENSSNGVLSTCNLPSLQSVSRKGLDAYKGKEKLSEYHDVNLQGEGRPSVFSSPHVGCGCKDYNSLGHVKDPADCSLGGCSSLSVGEVKVDGGDLIGTSLAGLKDGGSDVKSLYQEIPPADPLAGEAPPCTCSGQLKALDHSMSCEKEHDWSSESESESELEGNGESSVMSYERDANKQTHLSNVEGLDGQHHKTRENGYMQQGVRCTRDAEMDSTKTHLLKRCHKSDSLKQSEFCKSLRYSASLRGAGSLFSRDSVEDIGVRRSWMPISQDGLHKDKPLVKEKTALAGNVYVDSLVASCSSGVVCGKDEGVLCNTHVSTDGDNGNNTEVVRNGALEGSQQNHRRFASDNSMRVSRPLPRESHDNAGERLGDADAWRHVWQERVRRLRDTLRMAPGQELEQTQEDFRGRSRNRSRRRHQAMEKDALSFNYTFWRAEQVSSCNYVMSDISMCIATHAAQTLRDSEKEILSQAAIAGPLLVATVSHVNKHYSCHNL